MAISHAEFRNPVQDRPNPLDVHDGCSSAIGAFVQETFLAFLPAPGDRAPLDPILDALAWQCSDPYAEIIAAVHRKLLVAEFGKPAPGATLRSIMVRRL